MQTPYNPIDTMEELEQFRLTTLRKIKNLTIGVAIVGATFFILLLVLFGLGGGSAIVLIFVYVIVRANTLKKYRNTFRSIVVDKMWKNIDPEISFEPGRFIPMNLFKSSQIFKVSPNTYKGENHIYKKYSNFNLYASELDVTRRSGGKNNSNVPVFNGIFFVFELNKELSGTTLIIRDLGQNPLAFLSNIVESITHHKFNVMEYNNPEFEKYFKIYTTHNQETMQLVQTDLVIQLMATRMEKGIQMSFSGRHIYVAIDDRGTFFQADPKISLTDENSLRKYLNEIDKYQSYYSRFIPIVERISG